MAEHKAKVNPQYERALKLLKNKDKMSNKAYAKEFFAILKMGVKPTRKKAKGGIAGLSDVARDMFQGPKGIGAYQSFMGG